MSQSDFIQHKKTSAQLKEIKKLPPVFDTKDYISFKEYALENTISNTKITYNQLNPYTKNVATKNTYTITPTTYNVFGMQKTTTNCPTFTICKNTNLRTNRIPLGGAFYYPNPIRPLTQKQIDKQHKTTIFNSNLCNCTNI